MSIGWRGVCWFGFLLSSCFVSSGSALIGNSSPVPRSSSSSNYTLLFPLLVLPLPSPLFASSRFSFCLGPSGKRRAEFNVAEALEGAEASTLLLMSSLARGILLSNVSPRPVQNEKVVNNEKRARQQRRHKAIRENCGI